MALTSFFRHISRLFINPPANVDEQVVVELARLPDELIYSIVLKLPFKTLMRFRVLSKYWYSTLSVLRNKVTTDAAAAAACIIVYVNSSGYYDRRWGHNLYARRITMRSSCNNELYQFRKLGQLNSVSSPPLIEFFLTTSCNGLLCIASCLFTITCDDDRRSLVSAGILSRLWNPLTGEWNEIPRLRRSLVPAGILLRLWNPLTGEWNEIPRLPIECEMISSPLPEHTMVGLGYNHTIDDFNIVFLLRAYHDSNWLVQVMSLKTKMWMSVDPWPDLSRVDKSYSYYSSATADDVVYWIVSLKDKDNHYRILKCSLDKMKFEFISFPTGYREECFRDRTRNRVQCHNGSLYLSIPRFTLNIIDIWILCTSDDHGNAIWNKVDTIPYCTLLGFNSRGQIIVSGLTDNTSLHAYLPEEKKFVALDLSGYHLYGHLVQTETLACPY